VSRAQHAKRGGARLIGRDLARTRVVEPRRRRFASLALLGGLLAALGLTALRIDLIRVRYGLADAVTVEKSLLEERRALRARLGTLRNPTRLTQLAAQRKLARPKRVIEIPAVGSEVAQR
jgi:hypothetical protein